MKKSYNLDVAQAARSHHTSVLIFLLLFNFKIRLNAIAIFMKIDVY